MLCVCVCELCVCALCVVVHKVVFARVCVCRFGLVGVVIVVLVVVVRGVLLLVLFCSVGLVVVVIHPHLAIYRCYFTWIWLNLELTLCVCLVGRGHCITLLCVGVRRSRGTGQISPAMCVIDDAFISIYPLVCGMYGAHACGVALLTHSILVLCDSFAVLQSF